MWGCGNAGARSFSEPAGTGRRAGGQDGNRATRATRTARSQLPLAVPSSGGCSSPEPTVTFGTKQPRKPLENCQELFVWQSPGGDPPGSSCGCFGDQGRDKRNSHSRSVSPWFCHPLQCLSSSCSEQRGDLAPFVPHSLSSVWCLTLPSASLRSRQSFQAARAPRGALLPHLAPAPNQPGLAQVRVRGRRQRSGIIIPLGNCFEALSS